MGHLYLVYLAFGFVQAGKFGGFRSQSLIRFRHAAVLHGGLGKLPLGGTTQAVFFWWVYALLKLAPFLLAGRGRLQVVGCFALTRRSSGTGLQPAP